jgi:hypothetical protein
MTHRPIKTLIANGLLLVVVCLLISDQTYAHEGCKNAQVEYAPFDTKFTNKIVVQSVAKSFTEPDKKKRTSSPQDTAWFVQVSPDFTKPIPWTTEFIIGGNALKGGPFKVQFADHGSGGVSARWLNEKLLFIQVWWGRIGSTDMILDVSNRTFIYREMANYIELIQPCK